MRILSLVIVLGGCVAGKLLADPAPGIFFLHLRLNGERIELVEQNKMRGVVKQRGGGADGRGLEVVLWSERHVPLWKTVVPDPGVRRLEYVDTDGKLRSRYVAVTNAEFTVRIPAYPEGRSISVARRIALHRDTKAAVTQDLGRIVLTGATER